MSNFKAKCVSFVLVLAGASAFLSSTPTPAAPASGVVAQVVGAPQDITAIQKMSFITADMAKFYLAVGVMNAWECVRTQDPTLCAAYVQSLKDPVGHVGFLLFIAANHGTANAVRKITANRFTGMSLGLAAGMFAQDFFIEIYRHPLTKQYFEAMKRPPSGENRALQASLLNQLWKLTVSNPNWWLNKVPDLTGLIGAATLAGMKVPAVMKALDLTEKTIQFVQGSSGEIRAIGRARDGLRTYQAAAQGIKLFWNGTKLVRIHPVVMIGTQVVETIIFLKFAEWISEPAAHIWHKTMAVQALNKARDDFYEGRGGKTPAENSKALAKAWDNYRLVYSMNASTVQARYMTELQDLETQVTRHMAVALWVGQGMDRESPLATGGGEGVMNEKAKSWEALYSFFCGPDVAQAIEPAKSVAGLPVLGHERTVIRPFRIVAVRDAAVCDAESNIQLLLDKAKQGGYEQDLDKAFSRLEVLVDPLRKLIARRYDKIVQETLVHALSGTPGVPTRDGSMDYTLAPSKVGNMAPEGILPAFDVEAKLLRAYGSLKPQLNAAAEATLSEVALKREAAQDLLDYVAKSPSRRAIPQSVLDAADEELLAFFKEEKNQKDWEVIVRFWRGFVLTP